MKHTLEIQVNNVTPSQFLAYVRKMAKKKGLNVEIPSAKEFATLEDEGFGKFGSNDFWYTKPYAYHTYFKNNEIGTFCEICEFEFWDEKTGHGYYYLLDDTTEI